MTRSTVAIETRSARKFLFLAEDCIESPQNGWYVSHMPSDIPFNSIITVVREVVTRKPVREAFDRTLAGYSWEGMYQTAKDAGEAGIALPLLPVLIPAAAGAMAPFRGVKTHIESVRVLWADSGKVRSTNLFLSAKDTESLLKQLTQATGRPWREVRFDSNARDEHASHVLARFSQEVQIGNVVAWAGDYRLLMVAASDSSYLVYFFSQDQQLPQDALNAFLAEGSPLESGTPWTIRLKHNAEGFWSVSEINTDTHRLRLRVDVSGGGEVQPH